MRTPSRWSALAAKERNGEEKSPGDAPMPGQRTSRHLRLRACGTRRAEGRRCWRQDQPRAAPMLRQPVRWASESRADTIGLSAAAREEIESLAAIPEACRSKPPYATAAASSGKLAARFSRLTNGCAWNAVSAFANCGRAVAHVRGSYVPIAAVSRCSKEHRYSITSSARASTVAGTSSPSALAVF
jgi:hypothetical protein